MGLSLKTSLLYLWIKILLLFLAIKHKYQFCDTLNPSLLSSISLVSDLMPSRMEMVQTDNPDSCCLYISGTNLIFHSDNMEPTYQFSCSCPFCLCLLWHKYLKLLASTYTCWPTNDPLAKGLSMLNYFVLEGCSISISLLFNCILAILRYFSLLVSTFCLHKADLHIIMFCKAG